MNLKEKNLYLDGVTYLIEVKCENIKEELVCMHVDSSYFNSLSEIGDVPVSIYLVVKDKSKISYTFEQELNESSGYFVVLILNELEFTMNFEKNSSLIQEY